MCECLKKDRRSSFGEFGKLMYGVERCVPIRKLSDFGEVLIFRYEEIQRDSGRQSSLDKLLEGEI